MGAWWELLTGAEKAFYGIAIVSSILFLIQFILNLIGLDADTDVDIDLDLDVDADLDPGFSLDADFSLLSIRSIIAFFTFFGWAGVMTLNRGGGLWVAITFATLSGFAAMFVVAYMMFKFSQLDSSGTLDIRHAIENSGEVYLRIPEKSTGTGLIHVKVDGTIREFQATTHGKALPTGAKIKVLDVLENNILLVENAPALPPAEKSA
jgi:membrane protein implicated in regulation of membrane protease activity